MKIRTKLVLLLCVALVVTTVASTLLQVRLTSRAVETQAREQASQAALDIGRDLESHVTEDWDEDDIKERLKDDVRIHAVANIEFVYTSDESTVSVQLGRRDEEANVKRVAAPPKPKRPAVRRDEIRRALSDHGGSSRRPGERGGEPLWRTPDRNEAPGWRTLAEARRPKQQARPKVVLVDLRDQAQRQGRYLQVSQPVDLVGPSKGQLTVRMSLESVDRLARIETIVAASVGGVALVLLIVITVLIANRIVGRPVAELAVAMRGVERGDLSQRVAESGTDELGNLKQGFNQMLERLSVADGEIREFNARLADEVQTATADLAKKNDALGHLNRLLLETRRELGDKERLAALGQLAAQLAHEIGTPLGSVSGHLQLAISARDLPGSLKERLLVATRELERISKIVRDYLDSTRPIKPARIDCNLPRVVDEAVGIALGAAERPGLSIERRFDAAAQKVETDPGLLRQILVNLITNAIDAVGGRESGVDTRALGGKRGSGEIVVGARVSGGFVEIVVKDDGAGIAPEDAARIFEPFYTTKGRGKGTGLGLAICRELATALGGRIAVESTPGSGSTFTVSLPRTEAPVTRMEAGRA